MDRNEKSRTPLWAALAIVAIVVVAVVGVKVFNQPTAPKGKTDTSSAMLERTRGYSGEFLDITVPEKWEREELDSSSTFRDLETCRDRAGRLNCTEIHVYDYQLSDADEYLASYRGDCRTIDGPDSAEVGGKEAGYFELSDCGIGSGGERHYVYVVKNEAVIDAVDHEHRRFTSLDWIIGHVRWN